MLPVVVDIEAWIGRATILTAIVADLSDPDSQCKFKKGTRLCCHVTAAIAYTPVVMLKKQQFKINSLGVSHLQYNLIGKHFRYSLSIPAMI